MFGRNDNTIGDVSKQELQHRIEELQSEASRLKQQPDPDHEQLSEYFKELERTYRILADKEEFPLLEDKYRRKAANWRKAADEKRVVDSSPLTDDQFESNAEDDSAASTQPQPEGAGSSGTETPEFEWEAPEWSFEDIGGREKIIERLEELVIDPVEQKEQHQEYEIPVPNGILLEGPPGTGKSVLAKALASELDRRILDISLGDIREKFAGESEQNLQRLFTQAREHQPVVIIIDEVDSMVYSRTGNDPGAGMRELISQFLKEMPSLQWEDILIVGTTNLSGDLDDAAMRPGRFGHRFTVGMPDKQCRQEVLRVHLRSKPVASSDIDLHEVARHTHGYTCADLRQVTIEASRRALQQETVISQQHLKHGIKTVNPSVDPSKW